MTIYIYTLYIILYILYIYIHTVYIHICIYIYWLLIIKPSQIHRPSMPAGPVPKVGNESLAGCDDTLAAGPGCQVEFPVMQTIE